MCGARMDGFRPLVANYKTIACLPPLQSPQVNPCELAGGFEAVIFSWGPPVEVKGRIKASGVGALFSSEQTAYLCGGRFLHLPAKAPTPMLCEGLGAFSFAGIAAHCLFTSGSLRLSHG